MSRKFIYLISFAFAMTFANGIAEGRLAATFQANPSTATRINLTAVGNLDWAYWNFNTIPPGASTTPTNSKAGATYIGDLTLFPTGTTLDGGSGATSQTGWDVEWSNGEPTLSGTADNIGQRIRISSPPPADRGFNLTVAAGPDPRALMLYIHIRTTDTRIIAKLGDEVLNIDASRPTQNQNCLYTLVFSHPSAAVLDVNYFCPANSSNWYSLRVGAVTLGRQERAWYPIPANSGTTPTTVQLQWEAGASAAHHGDTHRFINCAQGFFDLACQLYYIELGPCASRANYQLRARAFTKAKGD